MRRILLFFGLLAAVGCGSATTRIPMAPPTAVGEVRPTRPSHEFVWVPGRWGWQEDHYVWLVGAWVKEQSGFEWTPGHWRQTKHGWAWDPGRWTRG